IVHVRSGASRISVSLHDALPISQHDRVIGRFRQSTIVIDAMRDPLLALGTRNRPLIQRNPHIRRYLSMIVLTWYGLGMWFMCIRSEEHTSELQSRENLVCRLLLE